MGFFTDLKEDLSQAVNELMPEETENGKSEEIVNLEELLDKVDAVETVNTDEMKEKEMKAEGIYTPQLKPVEKKAESAARSHVSDENAVITAGMSIKGDVTTEGSLELIGSISGNLNILGKLSITGTIQGDSKAAEIFAENAKITGEINSQGSVKIGQNTVIIGNIFATSAVIAGAIKGDIDVHGPVVLDTSAIVMGNIRSKSLQINNGAVIEGMCSQCYADVNPTSFFEDIKISKKAK